MSPIRSRECYERLPFPIAYHVHRCESREAWSSAETRAKRLADALEALVRYLAQAAVSDYLQQGAFDPKLNGHLDLRIRRSLPLGLWMDVLRETAAAFFRHNRETRPPGLAALLFDRRGARPQPSDFLRKLDALLASRNDLAHKPWKSPVDALARCYDDFQEVLSRLAYLADYPLVVPMKSDPGDARTITAVVECMGHPSEFVYRERRIEFPEGLGAGPVVSASAVLLEKDAPRVLLSLYPLTIFELGPSELSDELYRYDRSAWDGDSPHRVTFAPNHPGQEELEVTSHGERDWALRDFRSRFASVLSSRPIPPAPPPGGPDFRIPSLELEIDARHDSFVGRLADCDRLTEQLDRQGHGYVCYQAPFGAGKSSFASFLIRHFGWPGHLVKRECRRDQPARFLQHLLSRLLEAGDPRDLPDSTGALEELLFGALERASERLQARPANERVVIILDGLNYLPPEAETGFLFEALPPRVFFVLLSQPCPLLEAVRGRTRAPWADLRLEGLSDDDALEVLDRSEVTLPDEEREQVIRAAKGFPSTSSAWSAACGAAGPGRRHRPASKRTTAGPSRAPCGPATPSWPSVSSGCCASRASRSPSTN
jgi:hypothetical protein